MSEASPATTGKILVTDPWPGCELELLIRLVSRGKSMADLCQVYCRARASVYNELSCLATRHTETSPERPRCGGLRPRE